MKTKLDVIQEVITKIVQREIEKAKVEIRREMYVALHESTTRSSTTKTTTTTSSPTPTASRMDRGSIMEFLGMSSTDLKQPTADSGKVIDVADDVQLKPEVRSVLDVINSPDLAKKAKLMEQAAKRNR